MTTPAKKLRVNTEWLSDCGGCHVAIIDLHEKLGEVLGGIELQHCPVLTDVKGYPDADIGLITGAIRTEHDAHLAKCMRESCKTLVAFGTCALYGGIPGAALAHSRDEILNTVYVKNKTTRTQSLPCREVTPLAQLVTPIDQVIDVDLCLPGCPPHPAFIFDALLSIIQGRPPKSNDESICGRCPREMKKTDVDRIKQNHESLPEQDTCFLSQGYVCLGSVTLDRCMAPCPTNGVPCTGCAGPTRQILTEPNHDIRTELATRMSSLTRIERKEILTTLERQAKTHYAYAMASKLIHGKPTFLIKQWILDAEGEL
jgi:F420-non-reducing hydrogenase small subunit